jgi:hypothetical protein
LIFIGIPWVLGWIAKTGWAHQRQMKTLELRGEANARLLDRFGSDPNFLEFLKSDGQRSLFDMPSTDPGRSMPYIRMLTSIQVSFLLSAAGVACLWVRSAIIARIVQNGLPNTYNGGQDGFLFFGALGVALGVGSFLSAGAALVVGRMWGRLHADDPPVTRLRHQS